MDPVERLGELLRAAGFGSERHTTLAGYPGGVPSADLLAALDRPADARLAGLLAFFRGEEAMEIARADELLAPVSVAELADTGLVEVDGGAARACVMLAAISGEIVAGDLDRAWGEPDFVAGISPAGKVVAYTTIRRPVATALDLGTGSGIQALLAARHARQVVAVDVNPHALEIARLGARLGHVGNVEWVEGDWIEPVRGRGFDLVVCNPPVVISPDVTFLARDSEIGGAEISQRMVVETAAVLEEGGFATVLCDWAHAADGWDDQPRAWVEGTGCDALLLRLESLDALSYAMTSLGGAAQSDATEVAADLERWTDYYARQGIERIAIGVVVLRRRSGATNWARSVEANGEPSGPGSEQLERMFAGGDFLAANAGADRRAALLASRWQAVDGQRLEQTLTYGDGGYVAGEAVLSQPGLNVRAHADPRAAHLVVGCDGRATVGELIARGPAPADLDAAAFETLCLDAVAELIAKGFVTQA